MEFVKSRPVVDPNARAEWARQHARCQITGIPLRMAKLQRFPPRLETHHITKSRPRSDEPCNLLRVCPWVHKVIEGERFVDARGRVWPPITFGMVLKVKMESGEWNPGRLVLLHRNRLLVPGYNPLPEFEELPEFYLQERKRWESFVV